MFSPAKTLHVCMCKPTHKIDRASIKDKHLRFRTASPSPQRRSRRFASLPKTALSFEIGVRRTKHSSCVAHSHRHCTHTHNTHTTKNCSVLHSGHRLCGAFLQNATRVLSAQWLLPSCAVIRAASPKSPEETLGEAPNEKTKRNGCKGGAT